MARILYLTQIDIDPGVVRLLPEECARTGMRRPLICLLYTSPSPRD